MNQPALTSQVATQRSLFRADIEHVVASVFSAIAAALTTKQPVAIAASTVPSFRPAKALRDSGNG